MPQDSLELALLSHGCRHLDSYAPLAEQTGLFRIFADTDPTPEGCRRFANNHGLLGFRRCVREEPQMSTATVESWLTVVTATVLRAGLSVALPLNWRAIPDHRPFALS